MRWRRDPERRFGGVGDLVAVGHSGASEQRSQDLSVAVALGGVGVVEDQAVDAERQQGGDEHREATTALVDCGRPALIFGDHDADLGERPVGVQHLAPRDGGLLVEVPASLAATRSELADGLPDLGGGAAVDGGGGHQVAKVP